jgi:hypothetical protein
LSKTFLKYFNRVGIWVNFRVSTLVSNAKIS